MEILGIRINNLSLKEVESHFFNQKRNFVVTLNPEIILTAQKDEEYFYILRQADYSLVDGFGLKLASLVLGKNVKRLTGADLSIHLLNLAQKRAYKVIIINNETGLSSKKDIEKSLKLKWPDLNFSVIDRNKEDLYLTDTLEADILLVNFGAPYQEKFIYHNLEKIKNLKVAVGIGGSLDFISNRIKRAPKIFRALGLEWLWRLLLQPKRIVRIFQATIVFSCEFLKWRFIQPYIYRKNVVCFIYQQIGDRIKVLMVERRDQPGHWQLPQGGLDGQSIKKAGLREAKEELNISKLEPKAIFRNLYKYEFKGVLSKYGYRGQRQNLLVLKYLGQGNEIKINYYDHRSFEFVNLEDVLSKIAPIRKEAGEIYIKKFKEFIYAKK